MSGTQAKMAKAGLSQDCWVSVHWEKFTKQELPIEGEGQVVNGALDYGTLSA